MTKGGARVLVVDDEPAICRTLKTNLSRHGFQVTTEVDGAGAVGALDSWRPDIILLDLGLPDMDGVDVIREVRKRGSTPVIVLSVRETEQDKVAVLNLGADDYLTKRVRRGRAAGTHSRWPAPRGGASVRCRACLSHR